MKNEAMMMRMRSIDGWCDRIIIIIIMRSSIDGGDEVVYYDHDHDYHR
jgi:hypothetical protein